MDVSDCPLPQLRTRQAGEKRPPDEHFWARRSVGTSSRVLTLASGKVAYFQALFEWARLGSKQRRGLTLAHVRLSRAAEVI